MTFVKTYMSEAAIERPQESLSRNGNQPHVLVMVRRLTFK